MLSNADFSTGADPEFWNGGLNERRSIVTERRASMIEYLQVLVLSNCNFTVKHTPNRHFRSTCVYMN